MSTVQGRSEEGRAKRQKVLDYLNKTGVAAEAGELMKVTKEANRRTMVARLQRMHEFGELERETRFLNGKYFHFFTARVKTTAPIFEPTKWAAQYTAAKRGEARLDEEAVHPPKTKGPWHTVNRCDDRKAPIPRQGGQSSCTGFRRASIMAGLGN